MQSSPHYGLWVILYFFLICMRGFCFLPFLLVFVMNVLKCIAVCLITPIAARFLHLRACFTYSFVHVSTLHPLLAHHHLYYVDVNCVFFCFFSLYSLFFFCACGSFLLLWLLPLVCNLMCSLVILYVGFLLFCFLSYKFVLTVVHV